MMNENDGWEKSTHQPSQDVLRGIFGIGVNGIDSLLVIEDHGGWHSLTGGEIFILRTLDDFQRLGDPLTSC
jgi:hypothetical protein